MFPLNLRLQELLGRRNSLYMCFTFGAFQVSQTSSACLRAPATNIPESGKIRVPGATGILQGILLSTIDSHFGAPEVRSSALQLGD